MVLKHIQVYKCCGFVFESSHLNVLTRAETNQSVRACVRVLLTSSLDARLRLKERWRRPQNNQQHPTFLFVLQFKNSKKVKLIKRKVIIIKYREITYCQKLFWCFYLDGVNFTCQSSESVFVKWRVVRRRPGLKRSRTAVRVCGLAPSVDQISPTGRVVWSCG